MHIRILIQFKDNIQSVLRIRIPTHLMVPGLDYTMIITRRAQISYSNVLLTYKFLNAWRQYKENGKLQY